MDFDTAFRILAALLSVFVAITAFIALLNTGSSHRTEKLPYIALSFLTAAALWSLTAIAIF